MMELLITVIILAIVDIVGFVFKFSRDEKFRNYHLKYVPFIWFFWS